MCNSCILTFYKAGDIHHFPRPALWSGLFSFHKKDKEYVEPYDHQIKYNFYCRMTVTVLCMVVRSLTGGTHSLRYPTCGSSSPIKSPGLSVPALLPATSIAPLPSRSPATFHDISLPGACMDSFQFQTLKDPISAAL